jgi:adenosine deaminase
MILRRESRASGFATPRAGKTDAQTAAAPNPSRTSFFPLFSSYIYRLIDDPWALAYATTSVLRDFAADGVVYLELRTTPRAMPCAGLDKAGYVRTILDAIASFEASRPEQVLRTRLILSIDRRNSLTEAMEVVTLARQFKDAGVVGIDLCGDPSKGGVEALAPAFEETRKIDGLGITIHFAEAACSGTDEELRMLLSWRPDRIGHVIHVSESIRKEIIGRGKMGLELCLSCNVHAGMIDGGFEAHHFGEWWQVKDCVVALSVSSTSVGRRVAEN